MKIKDVVKLEEENDSKIFLIKEGLFFRAYEHSAWMFYLYVKQFKPIKRSLKVIGGRSVVSLGFPADMLDSILNGFTYEAKNSKLTELYIDKPFNKRAFEEWKDSISLIGNEFGKSGDKTDKIDKEDKDMMIQKIVEFDLLTSTPLDCFNFINDLKSCVKSYVK